MTKDELLLQYNLLSSRISTFFSHENRLHKARFAHPHELTNLLSPTLDGTHLLLGEYRFNQVLRVQATAERQELGHVLVVGPTRSGKSQHIETQLLTWPHPSIVTEPQRELLTRTGGARRRRGKVYVISPRGYGHQYDPLHGRETEDEIICGRKKSAL